MLGFVAGAVGVVLVMRWVRWRRWQRHAGHGGWHGRGWDEAPSPGAWRRRRLSGLFRRMDATPAQERVLLEAVEQVEGALEAAAREARGWGADLARAVQGEQLDAQPLRERFARQDVAREELRRTLLGALARVHEALQPDQRRVLARALDWGGGYRHRAAC
jgi:hypothetical protein